MRRIVVAVLVVAVLAGIAFGLYSVWRWEDRSTLPPTPAAPPPGEDLFVTELPAKPVRIAWIQCNEDEYEESFETFRRELGVKDDPYEILGGPILITLTPELGDLPDLLERGKQVTIEYLRKKAPDRFVLLAHEGCEISDYIGAWKGLPEDEVRERQVGDLRRAYDVLREWFPGVPVELYYVDREEGMPGEPVTLRFNPIGRRDPEGTAEPGPGTARN
jgi:hypothetical protein